MALINYFTNNPAMPQQPGTGQPAPQFPVTNPGIDTVKSNLESLLSSDSSYIENARRRGAEMAATRGGINSSIAAGAAERSAIEAAAPLAQQAAALDQQTQDYQMQDWMAQQNFGRNLFTQQFGSSLDMLNSINQMALMDPELYTPEVTSGMSNFFQKNMNNILKNYFGGAA